MRLFRSRPRPKEQGHDLPVYVAALVLGLSEKRIRQLIASEYLASYTNHRQHVCILWSSIIRWFGSPGAALRRLKPYKHLLQPAKNLGAATAEHGTPPGRSGEGPLQPSPDQIKYQGD